MAEYNKPPVLKKISFLFTALVIALLLLVFYYFFGRATIIITPSVRAVTNNFEITIKPDVDATDGSVMPGDIFSQVQELSRQFPVAEITEELPGRAKGEITIVNSNSSNQTLVATTRFLTPDNVLFRLDRQVVIPAGSRITANITADLAGKTGDIKPPLRLTIPGLSQTLQQRIYGEVNKPFSGGIVKQGTLSQSDIDKAHETLARQIDEDFQINYLSEYLTAKTTTTPTVAPDLFTQQEVNSITVDAEAGDLVNDFNYSISATIEGVAIKKSDLEIIAQNKLKASLAASEQFIGITPGSFTVSLKKIDVRYQIAILSVSIAGQSIYTQANDFIDRTKLIGMNEIEILGFFANKSGVESVNVEFSPFWVQKFPE